jgi:hypothetical protein
MCQLSSLEKAVLTDLYITCNTPRSLFNVFRGAAAVQDLAKQNSTDAIVDAFLSLGAAGIDGMEDLALAYALYISLTFKDYDQVASFFAKEGNIDFEWFDDIKSIYLASYTHTNLYVLDFDAAVNRPEDIAC